MNRDGLSPEERELELGLHIIKVNYYLNVSKQMRCNLRFNLLHFLPHGGSL